MLGVERTIYWNQERGSVAPLDHLLGIVSDRYSVGVREMACGLSLHEAFVPASQNLARMAQLSISHSALRDLVEREGRRAEQAIRGGGHVSRCNPPSHHEFHPVFSVFSASSNHLPRQPLIMR